MQTLSLSSRFCSLAGRKSIRTSVIIVLCAALGACHFAPPVVQSSPPQKSSPSNDDSTSYTHQSPVEARITVAFIPGSGSLSREQLDAPDFPGKSVMKVQVTVRLRQHFDSLWSLTGMAFEEYSAAAATVAPNPRLVGSLQVVRFSDRTSRREIISFSSHGFRLGGVVLADGDYIVAREVTGY